tara:strand:- start:1856 stop:2245 length:390 start_codon:yes stop_codon:yes gene_type:complete
MTLNIKELNKIGYKLKMEQVQIEMARVLDDVINIIETYHSLELKVDEGMTYSKLLKNLSSNLFYLERYRSEYYYKHNQIMFEFKGSVAASKIKADEQVPEIYLLRRTMNAAYRVADAMRSNISYIKKEQ